MSTQRIKPVPIKHLHGEDWKTACGLRSMDPKVRVTQYESAATCEECKRITRERHEKQMAENPSYRRFHETVAAFAALGIKAGDYGHIKLTFAEADKVLRKLKSKARQNPNAKREPTP